MSSTMHPRPSSVLSQPVPSSGYMSSSSSSGHGQYMRSTSGRRPSSHYSHYSVDTVNLAEAFADVNRALGSRSTRQSTGGSSSQAGPSRALKTPSPEPPRPRMLKKPQTTSDSSARMGNSRATDTRRREEVVNPRFSIASEPTYTRPPLAPWEHLRVQDSSHRASMAEQSTTPKRPDLRILIPGAPPARRAHRGQNDVAGQHKSTAAAPKDRSSCVVM